MVAAFSSAMAASGEVASVSSALALAWAMRAWILFSTSSRLGASAPTVAVIGVDRLVHALLHLGRLELAQQLHPLGGQLLHVGGVGPHRLLGLLGLDVGGLQLLGEHVDGVLAGLHLHRHLLRGGVPLLGVGGVAGLGRGVGPQQRLLGQLPGLGHVARGLLELGRDVGAMGDDLRGLVAQLLVPFCASWIACSISISGSLISSVFLPNQVLM